MILLWGLIILGLILLIRWLIGLGEPPKAEETPLDILKKRYAREEINKDEFEQKKDLQ
jgi:putative membrane protein